MMKKLTLLLILLVSYARAQTNQNVIDNGIGGGSACADGAPCPQRSDRSRALVVTDGHGRYQEATYRGNLFYLDSDAVTLAAANATKSVLGTVKLINGIYNPTGNSKLAVILYANVATTSGTPAGPYFWNFICGVTATNAQTGTIRSGYLSNSNGASSMSPEVNVVLTVSGAATTALIQLGLLGGPAAIAAGAGINSVAEDVAGRIIVPAGCFLGLTAAGAGTTHIVQSTIAYEEISQ